MAVNDVANQWVVFLQEGRPSVRARAKDALYQRDELQRKLPFAAEQASPKRRFVGFRVWTEVPGGWIIGFNSGEYGGELWWYSVDGKSRYKISDHQVMQFLETEAGLLALDGLAHGTISRGRIVLLTKGQSGRWSAQDLIDLKGAPEIGIIDADGSLVIATSKRLLRVRPKSKGVDVLIDKAFWGGLGPTSLVVASTGDIYIGMRHGVARAEKIGREYRLRWLLPSQRVADLEPKDTD